MSNPVARRYAQALAEEAERQDRVEAVDADAALIRESLEASPELENFFESPILSAEQKKEVVRALFEERLSTLTYRFLQLLVEKERETLLREVLEAYRALRDRQRGIVEVQARTAGPLDDAGRTRLAEGAGRRTGHEVRLRTQQDPALIGGVVLRIGDTVYDGSVRNQLAALRERMTNGHRA